MLGAKTSLKDAQMQQRDDEEAKVQELINKLEKSQVEYKRWMQTKEEYIQKQKEKNSEVKKQLMEQKVAKREQKAIASKAFEQWARIKKEKLAVCYFYLCLIFGWYG